MEIQKLKSWLSENILYSRGLICKKCKFDWFKKYDHLNCWNAIIDNTNYLDSFNPTLPQRIYHIINNILFIKCANPNCLNPPTFFSFNKGYLKSCSMVCSQYSPETISKIKSTNIEKYGVEYGLQNKDIIAKKNRTVKENYNVDNISQLEEISQKKEETCLKNYGTKWFLGRQDLKEKITMEKYGVKNVQQVDEISTKTSKTRTDDFYEKLIFSDRLKGKVIPCFSKDEYTGTCKPYDFKCTRCNLIFNINLRWDKIPRCPTCYPYETSLFEKEITEYIQSLLTPDILVKENDRSILLNNRELDIYIPSKNIAFECDGLFWHGEDNGNKNRKYHVEKTNECELKGIRLVHIFEDEWRDKQGVVKSKIEHILNCSKKESIFARKCNIVSIPFNIKKEFFNLNHIQGNDNSNLCFGLEYNNEVVSIISFCKLRVFMNCKNNVDGVFELSRYASLNKYNIVGGASKLLSHFIKTHNPKRIISYADRRWTHFTNNLYERIGFKKVNGGTPNYWYFGRKNDYFRHHRFGFAKHTLPKRLPVFDSNLTEWENMKNNGWDRIWDCGNLKYEMILQ